MRLSFAAQPVYGAGAITGALYGNTQLSRIMHPKQNERAIRKTKALMSKRKPEQSFCYAPTRECGCIFSMQFFSRNLFRVWRRWKWHAKVQYSGCICRFALGFCKNKKKRTETLYQSFSPFMDLMTRIELVNLILTNGEKTSKYKEIPTDNVQE